MAYHRILRENSLILFIQRARQNILQQSKGGRTLRPLFPKLKNNWENKLVKGKNKSSGNFIGSPSVNFRFYIAVHLNASVFYAGYFIAHYPIYVPIIWKTEGRGHVKSLTQLHGVVLMPQIQTLPNVLQKSTEWILFT